MLGLSQTTGYAIRALACLEGPQGDPMLVREIAQESQIPQAYLSKIIGSLVRKGLVSTKRGPRGGVILTRLPDEISLYEITEAIEGEGNLDRCLLGLTECQDRRACPTHSFWKATRESIVHELERISLHEAAEFERREMLRDQRPAR